MIFQYLGVIDRLIKFWCFNIIFFLQVPNGCCGGIGNTLQQILAVGCYNVQMYAQLQPR